MFLNTHVKALVTASLATVLVATIPSQVAGAADWSARIGTGHLTDDLAESGEGQHAPPPAPWSARIGTGHIVIPASPRSSIAPPAVHWSARIGTGNASARSASGGRYTESTS
jgi:hypothetical protein